MNATGTSNPATGSGGNGRGDAAAAGRTPPMGQLIVELRVLIVEYFKQETVVPLKQLGRYVLFGLLGALLLGLGAVLLGVGGLRALQSETGSAFTGNLSWVPYLIMVVVLLGVGLATWQARGAVKRRREAR